MQFSRLTSLSLIAALLLALNVHSRHIHHQHHISKKQKTKTPPPPPPAYAPAPEDHIPPTISPDPIYAPPPGQPEPPGNTTATCIFNVMDFGAGGDGDSDDTAAFRSAWKEACQVENGVVLAPAGLFFTITSTIFSGPCLPGLVFQVRYIYGAFF